MSCSVCQDFLVVEYVATDGHHELHDCPQCRGTRAEQEADEAYARFKDEG